MNDPLEALRQLTSHKAAVENAHIVGRNRDRSNVLSFEGDIPSDGMSIDTFVNNFGDQRTGIRVQVRNAVIKAAVSPTDAREFSLFIPLPGGKEPKLTENSEMGQMVKSVNACNEALDSILELRGTRITVDERVFTFKGRKNTGEQETDPSSKNYGKDIWVDAPLNVYYYHVTRIQGAGASSSNSTTATAPAPVTTDDLDWISNFLTVEGDKYEALSVGNVLIKLRAAGVNTDNHEIAAAVASKSLRQFLADRTAAV